MNNFDIKKIHSTGYWAFVFHPILLPKEKLTLSTLEEKVINNGIHLRGWTFPYYDLKDLHRENDGISLNVEFMELYEYWKYYESGQFVTQFAMIEDRLNDARSSKVLFILSTLYRITECIMFAANISTYKIYSNGIYLEIELHGCENRQLKYSIPCSWNIIQYRLNKYRCKISDPLKWSISLDSLELQKNSAKYSLDAALHFFERFGPFEDKHKLLETEQAKFIRGELKI